MTEKETDAARTARIFGVGEEGVSGQRVATAALRGLAMNFAANVKEFEELARLAERADNVIWILDPTTARDKRPQIDRHLRLTKAAATFARVAHELVLEELAELERAPKWTPPPEVPLRGVKQRQR